MEKRTLKPFTTEEEAARYAKKNGIAGLTGRNQSCGPLEIERDEYIYKTAWDDYYDREGKLSREWVETIFINEMPYENKELH